MSNVAGKAYGMTAITPSRPGRTWINRLLFRFARAFPATLGGLLGLSLIHFARWVIIGRDQWPDRGQGREALQNDYVLFCSNFNGTWDQYIDAFADGIPDGLDLFWYSATKYPGSIPITPFKNYIRANQVDTGYYYNATPGSAQRDIKLALKLAAALRGVDSGATDDGLAAAFRQLMQNVQSGLGAPGYAPVASCDTAAADRHRCVAVRARWGPGGSGPPEAEHLLHGIAPPTLAAIRTPADEVSESDKEKVRAAVDAAVASAPRIDEAPKIAAPPSLLPASATEAGHA
jgi:hypothetical protein